MSVQGWTSVFQGRQMEAELVAAVLRSHGLRAELLGGEVLVPDRQADSARRIVEEAGQAPPEPSEPGV